MTSRRGIWHWVALCVAVVAAAMIAAWQISLAIERRQCAAKSNSELLAMAREAAGDTTAEMGASRIDLKPFKTRYNPDDSARAEFAFRILGTRPQTADVWITRNCHAMVGWLVIMPPLR